MGFKLFKSGDDLFEEAQELIKMNDLDGARKKFESAVSKNTGSRDLAVLYIAIIDLVRNRGQKNAYQQVIGKIGAAGGSLKFGITDVDTEKLRKECEAYIHEIEAQQEIPDSEWMRKGQQMIAVAGEFASEFGDQSITLDELTNGNSKSTGTRESLILQAIAYETMGRGAVEGDPKQAAEYMQMAYTFRKQLGDSGQEDMDAMKAYSTSGRCWICGRPANGLGIHFVAQNATVSQMFVKGEKSGEVLPFAEGSDNGSPTQIYICMPCFTAISNRANQISIGYYNEAMKNLRETEARLQRQIDALSVSVRMSR